MTRLTRALAIGILTLMLLPGTISTQAQSQLNPKAVEFQKPGDIKFVRNAAGTQETAVLFGDPAKPGPYVVRAKALDDLGSRGDDIANRAAADAPFEFGNDFRWESVRKRRERPIQHHTHELPVASHRVLARRHLGHPPIRRM